MRTTINHARSFEDLIRRIEQVEESINAIAGETLICFQSTHPSRGKAVGGRTGFETVTAVGLASALIGGTCAYLAWWIHPIEYQTSLAYSTYLATILIHILFLIRSTRKYRYGYIDAQNRL